MQDCEFSPSVPEEGCQLLQCIHIYVIYRNAMHIMSIMALGLPSSIPEDPAGERRGEICPGQAAVGQDGVELNIAASSSHQ